jgi:ABC-type protease/lipase transport system fused ATPase/permease subunit
VLLDEPRNSLDEDGIRLLAAASREVTARGGAVVCCSPGVDSAGIELDRALVLENGRLRET